MSDSQQDDVRTAAAPADFVQLVLQATAAGTGCRSRVAEISSGIYKQFSLVLPFRSWNYSLSIIQDADIRRQKLSWFALNECYTSSGNAHKGHKKQTSIRRIKMKNIFCHPPCRLLLFQVHSTNHPSCLLHY